MKKTVFAGSATALVTPMKEDLSIDFDLFGTLIQEQIRHGTDALVVGDDAAAVLGHGHVEVAPQQHLFARHIDVAHLSLIHL